MTRSISILFCLVVFGHLTHAYSVVSNDPQPVYNPENEVVEDTALIEEEGRSMSDQYFDADQEAFIKLLNELLWDADDEEITEHQHEEGGRSYYRQYRSVRKN